MVCHETYSYLSLTIEVVSGTLKLGQELSGVDSESKAYLKGIARKNKIIISKPKTPFKVGERIIDTNSELVANLISVTNEWFSPDEVKNTQSQDFPKEKIVIQTGIPVEVVEYISKNLMFNTFATPLNASIPLTVCNKPPLYGYLRPLFTTGKV